MDETFAHYQARVSGPGYTPTREDYMKDVRPSCDIMNPCYE